MKFLKAGKETVGFQMDAMEKRLLFQVLSLYPLVPASHARLSKTEDRKEDQQLLDEALTAHRREQKKQVTTLLRSRSRFRANKTGFRLTLKTAQVEWIMQALNDVRIGSWLSLGSPDGALEILAALNEKTAPYLWAMEVAGQFQMEMLKSLDPP